MTWTEWLMFWTNTESNDTEDADDESGVSNATQRAVETIVSKIDDLSSKLQDRIASSEDRIDKLEEQIDDIDHDADYEPEVKEDDLDALEQRVEELEEAIDGFTEVYEAMSSQYNPLIDQQSSGEEAKAQTPPENTDAATPTTDGDEDAGGEHHNEETERTSHETKDHQAQESTTDGQHGEDHTLRDSMVPREEPSNETTKTPNKGSEKQGTDERNITIKDSLTDETEEFTLGEEPSRAEEERRQQELQRTTDDDVGPRSKEDRVEPVLNEEHVETQEPSFGPEHASEHIENPKLGSPGPEAQDTTESVVTEQRHQPTQKPRDKTSKQPASQPSEDQQDAGVNEHIKRQGQSQAHPETTGQGTKTKEQPVKNNENARDNTTTQQTSKTEENHQSSVQSELIHQLITKKRRNKDELTSVSDDEEFYVNDHQPLRDILDLATVLTDDPDVFKHHVLKERNFEDWIENSLNKPDLADDLRHIRSREDYITTLLAAE